MLSSFWLDAENINGRAPYRICPKFNFWVDLLIINCARYSKARKKSNTNLVRMRRVRINHALFISILILINTASFANIIASRDESQNALEGFVVFAIWLIALFWAYLTACVSFTWNVTFERGRGLVVYELTDTFSRLISYFWLLFTLFIGYVIPLQYLTSVIP